MPIRKSFFFHIPKTGGTSTAAMFKASIGTKSYIQENPNDFSVFDLDMRKFDFISGHYPVRKFAHLVDDSFFRFTFLRNPIAWLPSQAAHIVSSGSKAPSSIVQRLNREGLASVLSDLRTRDEVILLDNPQLRFVLGLSDERIVDRHVDEAAELLNSLDFVGLTEHAAACWTSIFASISAAWVTETATHVNTNPRNNFNILQERRDLISGILSHTKYDAQLYEIFQDKLQKTLSGNTRRNQARLEDRDQNTSINIVDLFRTADNLEIQNIEVGTGFQYDRDRILLHPPSDGTTASVTLTNVELAGHSRVSSSLHLAHPKARPILFEISIIYQNLLLCRASAALAANTISTIDVRFAGIHGAVTLTLSTRMVDPSKGNAYAWANFVQPCFSIAGR